MDSPVAKAALASLGAATTPMAVAELYTALQLGVVEGQENPLNTIYSHKFYEVQKYVALTGHMPMNLVLVINEKFYQSLSPELRQIFVKSMQDAGDFQSNIQIGMNKKNMQDLKDKGMVIPAVTQGRVRRADEGCVEGVRADLREGLLREGSRGGEVGTRA